MQLPEQLPATQILDVRFGFVKEILQKIEYALAFFLTLSDVMGRVLTNRLDVGDCRQKFCIILYINLFVGGKQ